MHKPTKAADFQERAGESYARLTRAGTDAPKPRDDTNPAHDDLEKAAKTTTETEAKRAAAGREFDRRIATDEPFRAEVFKDAPDARSHGAWREIKRDAYIEGQTAPRAQQKKG